MTTHRIEIRTPALPLPTLTLPALHLRRVRAVLVLQVSAHDAGAGRGAHEPTLAAATDRLERDRAAAHAARLGAL